MLFYNPPPSVRKKVEQPSFRVLADTLNSIERYGDYKYTKTPVRHRHPLLRRLKHLKHFIPPFDTWKGQLEYVAASSDGLDVLMYHISNTYDTRRRTWRAPFVDHSRYLDCLVTAVAHSLFLNNPAVSGRNGEGGGVEDNTKQRREKKPFVETWHLEIALRLRFDTPTRPNPILNETHTEIVEGIFFVLFDRLFDPQSGVCEWRLAKKMLDYTTQSRLEKKWGTAVKILTRYTELHTDLPFGILAWGNEGTYLHRCAYCMNHRVLKYLLSFEEGKRVINEVNHGDDTALKIAIKVNSIECVKTLLSFNARVDKACLALTYPGQQEIRKLLGVDGP